MELEILKNEEKRMNMILFVFLDVIPIVAVVYVLLFNGGSGRDAVALAMVAASLLIKVLYFRAAAFWRTDSCSGDARCFRGYGGSVFSCSVSGGSLL